MRVGRYQIIEPIGRGGMAEVYRAVYEPVAGMRKTLVLKQIHPDKAVDPEFVQMFLDEAMISLRLTHANIVHVFDFGESAGTYFLAMEFVHGTNLRAFIAALRERGRSMPIPWVAYITAQIAHGLAYAHQAAGDDGRPLRVVHRDMNPPNVLLSFQGEVKIADFGVAKAEHNQGQTRGGVVKGKVSYMAPEMIRGYPVSPLADMWGLGCCVYEMVAQQHPFIDAGATNKEKVNAVCNEPYRSLPIRDIPPRLVDIIDRLLDKDPSKRMSSPDQVAALLGDYIVPGTERELGRAVAEWFPENQEQVEDSALASRADFDLPPGFSSIQRAIDHELEPTDSEAGRPRALRADPVPATAPTVEHTEMSPAEVPLSARRFTVGPAFVALFALMLVGLAVLVAGEVRDLWPELARLADARPTAARPTAAPAAPAATTAAAATTTEPTATPAAETTRTPRTVRMPRKSRPTPKRTARAAATAIATGPPPTAAPTRPPEAATIAVHVTSMPAGADIRIDGTVRGRTPAWIRLPQGARVKVDVGFPGMSGWSETVTIPAGEVHRLHYDLGH